MSIRLRSMSVATFLILALFLVVSCGSDDPVVPPDPVVDTQVTGAVVKGPVTGAQVEIRTLGGDGSPGELVAGPVATDANGVWSATIPASHAGTVFLVVAEAGGGTYNDEATGNPVTIPAGGELLGYLDRAHPNSVAVTPYTNMLHLMVREVAGEMSATAAWTQAIANAADGTSFGFDLTTTIPSQAATATGAEKAHAALLGGLASMLENTAAYDPIDAANPYAKAMAVAEDLIDGNLDGLGAAGLPIAVPMTPDGSTTEPLPVISVDGVGLLNDSAATFAAGTAGLEDADLNPDMGIGPVWVDPLPCEQIEAMRAAARTSLANTLYTTINDPDPEAPRDVDFSEPRSLYEDVLECDENDLDAHLALALLDLTALSLDTTVNDAFDEWEAYLDAMVPFEVDNSTARLSVPTGLSPEGAMDLPFDAIQRSLIPYLRLENVVAPPQIADVQDIFRNQVLPRVVTGIDHIDAVLDNPAFTFSISARMQGDLLEEAREADATDFLALRAGLNALEAGLRIAISYQVNLTEHTGAVLLAGLNQTSGDLATLHDDGQTQMQMVAPALAAAADDLDAAIDALMGETDDQSNDLIKIGPNDLDQVELLEFQADELQMIRDSLVGPISRTYDWDFQPGTPDQAMTVDLNAFFTDPVENFKALLPPYTVSLEIVPHNDSWHWSDGYPTLSVTVPAAGNYNFYCRRNYENFELANEECDAPAWAEDAVDGVFLTEEGRFLQDPEWTGEGSIRVEFWGGSLDAGEQTINVYVQTTYYTTETWVEVATVTFAADTFSQWLSQWPDPTLGGLFPDVTTASQVTDAFGMDEGGWSKEFSLDWADGDIGFDGEDDGPILPPGS